MTPYVWRGILAFALLSFASWFTLTHLLEAFGSGPPYYSRTTNMDKWQSPVPLLVGVDAAVLIAVVVLAGPLLKRRQER
jgi:hypothetical protein